MDEQGLNAGAAASSGLVERDHACVVCGYNLRGIARSGACPECGALVERSFRGDELIYSSPEYVAALHKGVFIVLAGIIAMILMTFASVGAAIFGAMVAPVPGIEIASVLASFVTGVVVAVGWWMLSEPDPASREGRKGETARKIVRICTIVGVAIQCASLVVTFALPTPAPVFTPPPPPGAPPLSAVPPAPLSMVAMIASVGIALLNMVAAAVSYFAQMIYIRWLAPRLPDVKVFDRAKLLMWLGPLLYTVGALCVGIGPLVALVLYWNMLDLVRKDLKRIRESMAAGQGALA